MLPVGLLVHFHLTFLYPADDLLGLGNAGMLFPTRHVKGVK